MRVWRCWFLSWFRGARRAAPEANAPPCRAVESRRAASDNAPVRQRRDRVPFLVNCAVEPGEHFECSFNGRNKQVATFQIPFA